MKVKINKPITYILAVLAAAFLLSLILFLVNSKGKRFTMIFPSVDDGKKIVETRYMKINPESDEITSFVSDLLLGSTVERTKLLFCPETKVNSCFLRNGVLYLDLSEDIIALGDNVIDIKSGIELLDLNIKSNFSEVKDVQYFVNGKYAFE